MGSFFFITVITLFAAAVFTQQGFVFTLLYLLVSVYVINMTWARNLVRTVTFERTFTDRVFQDETVRVQLSVHNGSWLPLVWGRVHEAMPSGVSLRLFQQVISLAPRQKTELTYELVALKRGIYALGPLKMVTGDLMGFSPELTASLSSSDLIVYPRVVQLGELNLPSHSPLGTKKYRQPVFEDPSRPIGKREYQPGDSIRRLDWKASASSGKLQVRLFEPSIALEAGIFLDLNQDSYDAKRYFDAGELAISAAASLANWLVEQRQSVGLFSNGVDPYVKTGLAQPLPPRKGRAQLMRILENLARVQMTHASPMVPLLNQQRVNLAWGSTMILVSGGVEEKMFNALLQARRSGLDIVIVLCGSVPDLIGIQAKAKLLHIRCYHLLYGLDLKQWGTA
jgi:uncharacterized protein (DUF58 family)